MNGAIPVIAIDGPSASGKGTVAALVARELGFHYLDSGAIYRVAAHAAARASAPLKQAADALLLDTTGLSIDQAVRFVIDAYRAAA